MADTSDSDSSTARGWTLVNKDGLAESDDNSSSSGSDFVNLVDDGVVTFHPRERTTSHSPKKGSPLENYPCTDSATPGPDLPTSIAASDAAGIVDDGLSAAAAAAARQDEASDHTELRLPEEEIVCALEAPDASSSCGATHGIHQRVSMEDFDTDRTSPAQEAEEDEEEEDEDEVVATPGSPDECNASEADADEEDGEDEMSSPSEDRQSIEGHIYDESDGLENIEEDVDSVLLHSQQGDGRVIDGEDEVEAAEVISARFSSSVEMLGLSSEEDDETLCSGPLVASSGTTSHAARERDDDVDRMARSSESGSSFEELPDTAEPGSRPDQPSRYNPLPLQGLRLRHLPAREFYESDSDHSDFFRLDPSHDGLQVSASSSSSISSSFRFVQPLQNAALNPDPPRHHARPANQDDHEAAAADGDDDDNESLPPDVDDRCESDISGVAPDDEDFSTMTYYGDLQLTEGDVVRSYKFRPNKSLNACLTALALLALFTALGIGFGHYLGSQKEAMLYRQQVVRVQSLQDDYLMCLRQQKTLQSKVKHVNEDRINTVAAIWKEQYEELILEKADMEIRIKDLESELVHDITITQNKIAGHRNEILDLEEAVQLHEELHEVKLEKELMNTEVSKLHAEMDSLRVEKEKRIVDYQQLLQEIDLDRRRVDQYRANEQILGAEIADLKDQKGALLDKLSEDRVHATAERESLEVSLNLLRVQLTNMSKDLEEAKIKEKLNKEEMVRLKISEISTSRKLEQLRLKHESTSQELHLVRLREAVMKRELRERDLTLRGQRSRETLQQSSGKYEPTPEGQDTHTDLSVQYVPMPTDIEDQEDEEVGDQLKDEEDEEVMVEVEDEDNIDDLDLKNQVNHLANENDDLKTVLGKIRYGRHPGNEAAALDDEGEKSEAQDSMLSSQAAETVGKDGASLVGLQQRLGEVKEELRLEKARSDLWLSMFISQRENASSSEGSLNPTFSSCLGLLLPDINGSRLRDSLDVRAFKNLSGSLERLKGFLQRVYHEPWFSEMLNEVQRVSGEAAEKGKEMQERYLDLILQRWQAFESSTFHSHGAPASGTEGERSEPSKNNLTVQEQLHVFVNKTRESVAQLSDQVHETWSVVKNLSGKFIHKNKALKKFGKDVEKGIHHVGKAISKSWLAIKKQIDKHVLSSSVKTKKDKKKENNNNKKGAKKNWEKLYGKFHHKKNQHTEQQGSSNRFENVVDRVIGEKNQNKQTLDDEATYKEFWKLANFEPDDFDHDDFFQDNDRQWRKHQKNLRKLLGRLQRLNDDIFLAMDDDDVEDMYEDLQELDDDVGDLEQEPDRLKTWLTCQLRWWKSRLYRKHLDEHLIQGCGSQLMRWQLRALCRPPPVCKEGGKNCAANNEAHFIPQQQQQTPSAFCQYLQQAVMQSQEEVHDTRDGAQIPRTVVPNNKDSSHNNCQKDERSVDRASWTVSLGEGGQADKVYGHFQNDYGDFRYSIDLDPQHAIELTPSIPNVTEKNSTQAETEPVSEVVDDDDPRWYFRRAQEREDHYVDSRWYFSWKRPGDTARLVDDNAMNPVIDAGATTARSLPKWIFQRAEDRESLRHNGAWYFDRVDERDLERNKPWYYRRADDRSNRHWQSDEN